jgi:hypothetical protein
MWEAHAIGWFARSYRIEEDGEPLATLEFAAWRERGTLSFGKRRFSIEREGRWRPGYSLRERGETLATAGIPSAFRRGLVLTHEGEEYALAPTSLFARSLELRLRGRGLGQVRPLGWLGRHVSLDLDESLERELPPEVRLFVLWLAILTWRRSAAAAATAG